jgi:hypothetical protein
MRNSFISVLVHLLLLARLPAQSPPLRSLLLRHPMSQRSPLSVNLQRRFQPLLRLLPPWAVYDTNDDVIFLDTLCLNDLRDGFSFHVMLCRVLY